GSATVTANAGTTPYTYDWSTSPAQNTATASNLVVGDHTCTITDANGCSAIVIVTIAQPAAALNASISASTNVACFGNSTGSATVSVSGGTASYGYSWNTVPAQTTATASNLTAGSYTCTITDANGCSTTVSASIGEPNPALSATILASSDVDCNGNSSGSATVHATGGAPNYSYNWNTVPAQTTPAAINLAAGNYSCIVTDANGCSANANVVISEPASALSVIVTNTVDALCFGGSEGTADASAGGGTAPYSYAWSTAPVQNTANATGLGAGSYTITTTDANGCTAVASAVISGPASDISGYFEDVTHAGCFGESNGAAVINVSGGSGSYSYLWNTVPQQTGDTATGLPAGNYIVTVSDNNGCTHTKGYPVTILGASSPLLVDLVVNNITCPGANDGGTDLTMSGGYGPYTHFWTDTLGNLTGMEDLSGLSPDLYFLHAFDAIGCVFDTSFSLNDPPALALAANISTAACEGTPTGAIDLLASGGTGALSYAWSGPNGYTAVTEDLNAIIAGTYAINVSDANGCSISGSYDVSQPGSLQLSATASDFNGSGVTCYGVADGSIGLTLSGGSMPYTIAWVGPNGFTSNSEDIASLEAGTYTVNVSDANGCALTSIIDITAPASLQPSVAPSSYNGYGLTCNSASDGFITTVVAGGTGPFAYA
ncbi:MAG TPA: SprB repeat-containing protein, partial [Flavobacteriales bacterium]|nr:SprB repeat-containing protein [Flavobacteriales bacterium]